MSMERYVVELSSKRCEDWLLNKHYLKRMPAIIYAFGLVVDEKIEGVATFSNAVARFDFSIQPYELSRLVMNEPVEKNSLSWFLSNSLNMIKKPHIIVSYADENQGHHGYIYQATNWMYTGRSSKESKYFIDGKEIHRRSLFSRYGTSSLPALEKMGHTITYEPQVGKHRYFQVTGDKKAKRTLRKEIESKYEVLPYPKGENKRYDASYDPGQKFKINTFW